MVYLFVGLHFLEEVKTHPKMCILGMKPNYHWWKGAPVLELWEVSNHSPINNRVDVSIIWEVIKYVKKKETKTLLSNVECERKNVTQRSI